MALPFLNGTAKKRDQMIAIDLGGRTTKAVYLVRKGDKLVLSRFALLDAPIAEKNVSPDLLAEHIKAVCQALEAKTRNVTLALGVHESVVRHAELPLMPVGDMRMVLKNNTKAYLQQDLPGYVFDCHPITIQVAASKVPEKAKIAVGSPKQKVLVAGAKKQALDDLQSAIKGIGLIPDHVIPGLIGPVNSFEAAMPDVFHKEVVALVDLGFKHTSICMLHHGELVLSRVVGIGGDRFTAGLAESLGISYAEAEGIKIGMPHEVQSQLESFITPLARELRASIDFFEHQHDSPVAHVFVCGGSSRSEFILQTLQTELLAECKQWNPIGSLQVELPPQQAAEIEQVAPQLAVAVGSAIAAF
jgi:type IV pilus assembly protein PilM